MDDEFVKIFSFCNGRGDINKFSFWWEVIRLGHVGERPIKLTQRVFFKLQSVIQPPTRGYVQ